MCGIVGYIGKKNAQNCALSVLEKLEYRGYDSSGIAFFENSKIKIIKKSGDLSALKKEMSKDKSLNFDNKKFKDEKFEHEKFEHEKFKHEKFKNEKFKDEKFQDEKFQDEKFEHEKFENKKFKDEKFENENLEKNDKKSKTNFDCESLAIGHTRWATHGKPSDTNAHPHISSSEKCCIVHNGIIENFEKLKNEFCFNLKSETDSEIIAELLDFYFYLKPLERIKKVCSLIQGSYALAILFHDETDKIYCVKNHSPLVCAISESGVFCSSDANALEEFAKEFFILKDDEVAILKSNEIAFFKNLKKISKQPFSLSENKIKSEKTFCTLMEKEIHEIPESLFCTMKEFDHIDEIFFKSIFAISKKIYLIGCGTAYHSCLIGKLLIEKNLEIVTSAEIASEFISSCPIIDKDTLCVFVSQSGETSDTIKCLEYAKEKGAKTFALTNTKNSSITFLADYHFITQAGIERAVASTKAYVCQVAFFFCLCLKLTEKNISFEKHAKQIRKICEKVIDQDISKLSDYVLSFKKIFFIGRNKDYVTAKESSLKLKEITYINSIDIPAGELKHGTLALIDEESLVFAFFTDKNLLKKNISSVFEIISRKGKVIIFTIFDINLHNENIIVQKLPSKNEMFSPLYSIIPLQKLSLEISKAVGNNPDKPRNLAKSVTVE